MAKPFAALTDLKVLVVEDEAMIAMMLEDVLQDLGCRIEVAPSIERALAALDARPPDGVLLDMNIHGQRPVAVAEALTRRGVPFLLVTGYSAGDSDPPLIKAAPRLQKPFTVEQLGRAMVQTFVAAATAAQGNG